MGPLPSTSSSLPRTPEVAVANLEALANLAAVPSTPEGAGSTLFPGQNAQRHL